MKPRDILPAGTQAHREHYAEVVRATAFRLAEALGTGELDNETYRGLPVGDARCQRALQEFMDTTENKALELFDQAVSARDLPVVHNVRQLRIKKA